MPTVNMTARSLAALKLPGTGRIDYWDADTPGLGLRLSAAGHKVWVLMYRHDGVKKRLKLGTYPKPLSLADARELAEKNLHAVQFNNADPAADKQARKAAETFRQVAGQWAWRHGRPNKTRLTLKRDIQMLRRHVLPRLGAMKASEIVKRNVVELLDAVAKAPDGRMKTGKRARRARRMSHQPNRVFELVRSILRWAVGRDLLQSDPTAGLKPPIAKERPRERELSPTEIRTLWLALDKAPATRERWKRCEGDFPMRRATALAIKLALATGQRIGEVTGIPLAELDLNDVAPAWTIPGHRCKNGQQHYVPLSALAVRLISEARELAGDSPWLFPSAAGDGPMDPYAPVKALARARRTLGLGDIRVHDLRRSAATRMEELGVLPHVISHVLNHVSVTKGSITNKVYAKHHYRDERREALGKWGARLEEIIFASAAGNNHSLAR